MHVVACIVNPHVNLDKNLTIQYIVACYSPIIERINGEDMQEKADGDSVDPPVYHKCPRRPTKN